MSDWQKVRVTFNDADGNEVSAVMWQNEDSPQSVCTSPEVSSCWIGWNLVHGVMVSPIRELPTGVGAVIRVVDEWTTKSNPLNVFTLDAQGWWHGDSDVYRPEQVAEWQYEVLSEGIQIGGNGE